MPQVFLLFLKMKVERTMGDFIFPITHLLIWEAGDDLNDT